MRFWILAFIGGLIVAGHQLSLRADAPQLPVEVLHCHDGDTCRVKVNGAVWFNVRLAGIDAPEVKGRGKPGQPFAEASRDFVTEHLKGKTVNMRQTDLDHYNRPIVEFYVQKKLFNVQIVEQGLAEAYRGKTKRMDKTPYIIAEEQAKRKKAGIWQQSDYKSPATYRKKR